MKAMVFSLSHFVAITTAINKYV